MAACSLHVVRAVTMCQQPVFARHAPSAAVTSLIYSAATDFASCIRQPLSNASSVAVTCCKQKDLPMGLKLKAFVGHMWQAQHAEVSHASIAAGSRPNATVHATASHDTPILA